MRGPLAIAALLLFPLLATLGHASAGASLTATIEPTVFDWAGTRGATRAPFTIHVTNTGDQLDAFVLASTAENNQPGAYHANYTQYYAPNPALVLSPGQSGDIRIWQGGLELPPPTGPPAGDYPVHVVVMSLRDESARASVDATIHRTFPAIAPASLAGRVLDARTGAGVGAASVTLRDPADTNVPPSESIHQTTDPGGGFRFASESPGSYWLVVDAPGYASGYAQVTLPGAADITVRVEPGGYAPVAARSPTRVATLPDPVFLGAFTPDLARLAAVPGFYTHRPTDPPEALTVTDLASGARLVSSPIGQASALPYEYGPWTTDHAADITSDGALAAMGTNAGVVEVDRVAPAQKLWSSTDAMTQNPLVPRWLGQGYLRADAVKFSPDGSKLAAGTLTGFVLLFDASSGAKLWSADTRGQVQALAFSPDGARVYAGSDRLYALDAASGATLWSAPLGYWPFHKIAVSSDGARVAAGGKDGVLHVISARDGVEAWQRTTRVFVTSTTFSPDGATLYAAADDGLYAFDAAAGDVKWFRPENPEVENVALTSDGAFLAYSKPPLFAGDAMLRVLDAANGTPVWSFAGPDATESPHLVGISATRVAAAGFGATVYVFDDWRNGTAATPARSGTSGNATPPPTSPPNSQPPPGSSATPPPSSSCTQLCDGQDHTASSPSSSASPSPSAPSPSPSASSPTPNTSSPTPNTSSPAPNAASPATKAAPFPAWSPLVAAIVALALAKPLARRAGSKRR